MFNIDLINISKKIRANYNEFLKPLSNEVKLPSMALEILLYLYKNPKNNTSVDICKNLGLKSSIVSTHVENLVKEKYLCRSDIDGDRRKIGLLPTDKALPVINKVKIIKKKYMMEINKGLTKEDIERVHAIFQTIENNISLINKGVKQ